MKQYNTEPIDIIVPYVNFDDPVWRKDFEYWKQKETGNKDTCRYRDWGFIKYVFRSIEENCHWCRYVFLVLSGPSQIPEWLNVNHPKLKIVYHKDYIPEEFLPTFNSNVIELFYSRIKELSENFILINDDMFFCQKKGEDFYFRNDLPTMSNNQRIYAGHDRFTVTLHNTRNVSNSILHASYQTLFNSFHLPVCYKKSLQQFILTKVNLEFMKTNKFRKTTDITHFLFLDIQGKLKKCTFISGPFGITYATTHNRYINFNFPTICIEEDEHSNAKVIMNMLSQLDKHFKKCTFEK